jgi:hypothetical protein
MTTYTIDDIKNLLDNMDKTEVFIENLVRENSYLTGKLNRVEHELQRVIKSGGAEPSWAQELLDKIK